jgi:hypothetical protein
MRDLLRGSVVLAIAGALVFVAGCANGAKDQDANERVTGSGGKMVRYSSRQVTVDLTPAEQSELNQVRERGFPDATPAHALQAVAAALKASGYAPVTTDTPAAIVEGGRSEVLIAKWREVLRGVLKSKVGMLPAKPDHQYTTALVSVRADGQGGATVRARFDNTVWDSNGDSQSKTVIAPSMYDDFFKLVSRALAGEPLADSAAQASGSAAANRAANADMPTPH